ncbi:MAG: hypothetical protein D6796_13555, partial [Caldilineae bacterium]
MTGNVTPPAATIAYIAQMLPNLHATFIYREIFALRKRGFRLLPLSVRRPDPRQLSAEAKPLLAETRYIFPLRWRPLLA